MLPTTAPAAAGAIVGTPPRGGRFTLEVITFCPPEEATEWWTGVLIATVIIWFVGLLIGINLASLGRWTECESKCSGV